MKKFVLVILLCSFSLITFSQKSDTIAKKKNYRNYISIDIPACFLQQAGITYEYRTNYFGFGVSAGYIYPLHTGGTSILLGDWGPGTLDYSKGVFINPQFNFYFPRKWQSSPSSFYVGIKPLFKYAFCDSTVSTSWKRIRSDDFLYRRQVDNYYSFGALITLGFKVKIKHFFIDIYSGAGWRQNIHKLYVVAQGTNHAYKCAPFNSETVNNILALQFGIKLGFVF
jgi:hypothetical protein